MDRKQIANYDFVRADVAEIDSRIYSWNCKQLAYYPEISISGFYPGLSFGERKLTYNIPVWEIDDYQPLQYYSIKSTFLDFPLLFKYKARRINNDRPYVIFGPAYRQDISRTGKEDLVRLKKGGLYAEVGIGWDHYFTFFRFSAEAKISLGINDQLGTPPSPKPAAILFLCH